MAEIPVIPEEDRDLLSREGYDVSVLIGSGASGHVFSGVCNENAFKDYTEVSESETQTTSDSMAGAIGGTGVVRMRLHGRRCAVKLVISTAMPGSPEHMALLKEASILSKLNHPNVVELYFVTTLAHREAEEVAVNTQSIYYSYIVMEYSNGGTLAQLIQRYWLANNRFEEWIVKNWFTDLVEGLRYMHSMGVEHGDVNPGNVMLNSESVNGCPLKYIDFGRALEVGVNAYFAQDIEQLGQLFLIIRNMTNIVSIEVWDQLTQIFENMMNEETDYLTVNALTVDLMPVVDKLVSIMPMN